MGSQEWQPQLVMTGAFAGSCAAPLLQDRTRLAVRRRTRASGRRRNMFTWASNATFDIESFVRPELIEMKPYVPILPYEVLAQQLGRDPQDIVKLDANENSFGPSPRVAEALRDASFLHIYPDPECSELRDELEKYTGVSKDHILVGAGADELIDLLFRLVVTPGKDSVCITPPTFGMYAFDSDVNAAKIINVSRDSNFALDVAGVEKCFDGTSGPKMVFVTSPNNPDGSRVSDDDLRRLLALPTLVVLDEAYFEFSQDNRILWVEDYPNLVVLRTFSKWAALAGMRIGYGAFPKPIIKHLWKIKQPYNVSVGAQIAATVSLRDKQNLLDKVDSLIAQRDRFYETVKSIAWLKPYPSHSNYVLCRVTGIPIEAPEIKRILAEDHGVLIRHYTSPGLDDCIRISMGTARQMDRLFEALLLISSRF